MEHLRIVSIGFVLLLAAVRAPAGINYQLRSEHEGKTTVSAVWADGSFYRAEAKASEDMPEFQRQYPIVISTDGGKTHRYLRPADETWYELSRETPGQRIVIGKNARVRQPKVALTEESSTEQIAGLATRKYVLKASCVLESDEGSEKLKLHKARTVLLWVSDVACAPAAVRQLHLVSFGVTELDEPVGRSLASIEGFIVRQVDSFTERYEGGSPRTLVTTTEVIEPRCLRVDPTLFTVPKGYRHQEPRVASPVQ